MKSGEYTLHDALNAIDMMAQCTLGALVFLCQREVNFGMASGARAQLLSGMKTLDCPRFTQDGEDLTCGCQNDLLGR